MWIRDWNTLSEFRNRWGGRALLDRLPAAGTGLIRWPVGTGKSYAIDEVVIAALGENPPRHDLVIVFCPTHRVIEERRHVQKPGHGLQLRVLKPRPRQRCGDLDAPWQTYEQLSLGTLAREELCTRCPNAPGCEWLDQYTQKRLNGTQVVYATHTHLRLDPSFVDRVVELTGAVKPLVLIDEATWFFENYRFEILPLDLERFYKALKATTASSTYARLCEQWRHYVEVLILAGQGDLSSGGWKTPPLPPPLALELQRTGSQMFPGVFRFIGRLLEMFGRSPAALRERTDADAIRFTLTPRIEHPMMVFSATLTARLLRWRLDREVIDLFPELKIFHHGTRWYNIHSGRGAASNFSGNAPQIFDFFGLLIAKRVGEGRRPVAICRKRFVTDCVNGLNKRFAWLGHGDQIVAVPAAEVDSYAQSSRVIVPVLHYGLIGINRFEHHDCCFCLGSYYVNGTAVEGVVQGLLPEDEKVPIEVTSQGPQRERVARTKFADHHIYDHDRAARESLQALEHAAVIQAVGRVRPFTQPREVVTFQTSDLPGVPYEKNFYGLEEARHHFGIPRRTDLVRAVRFEQARHLIAEGANQRQVAESLGVTTRTIQRDLKSAPRIPPAWRILFADPENPQLEPSHVVG